MLHSSLDDLVPYCFGSLPLAFLIKGLDWQDQPSVTSLLTLFLPATGRLVTLASDFSPFRFICLCQSIKRHLVCPQQRYFKSCQAIFRNLRPGIFGPTYLLHQMNLTHNLNIPIYNAYGCWWCWARAWWGSWHSKYMRNMSRLLWDPGIFFKIPIPGFSKIESRDFSGFPETLKRLYYKAFKPFHWP